MEVDDLVAHHLVVRDVEIDVVVGAEPGGTPVDLTHLPIGVAHLQPVADLVGPIDLNRYAPNDSGKKILSGKAKDDCNNAGTCQESFQLGLGVIAVTQNKKQYDQEDDSAGYLPQEMRNRCLPFIFEIKIPNVAVNQSNDQCSAKQNRSRPNMIAPGRMNSVHSDRGIEGQD